MNRFVVLASLAGCSAPARAPVTTAPLARYTLQPLELRGPEGLHSASHSTTTVMGALELRDTRATLTLVTRHDTSFVHCKPEPSLMQACADDSQQPFSRTEAVSLTGDARWSDGKLVMGVHDATRQATLTCTQDMFGLACGLEDHETLFTRFGERPTRLRFASPGAKRFTLEQVTFKDGPTLTGALELTDATAVVRLHDGTKRVELRGGVSAWGDGLLIQTGPAVGRTNLRCTALVERLACELTVDPEVFGRPAFWGPVAFSLCQLPAVAGSASRPRPASRGGTRDPLGEIPEGFAKS